MPTSSSPSNPAPGANVTGIDISAYQGNEIDTLTTASGLGFIICKATEGITYTDPDFAHNWSAISAKGFVRGAYHFYHSNDDPTAQAANFLKVIGNLNPADLPPIIDVEETSINNTTSGNLPTVSEVQTTLLAFLNIIESKTGRRPMIYTDTNIGNAYLGNPVFSKYPLYLAYYNTNPPAQLPGAWKGGKWTIWQKTDSQAVGAYKNDYDVFNGDINGLKAFIKGKPMV